MRFDATVGTQYRIAVNGPSGLTFTDAAGDFLLDWQPVPTPANDDFASAQVLAAVEQGSVDSSNAGATSQPNEPYTTSTTANTPTVWFSWTAPTTKRIRFWLENSQGQSIDVFTGTALTALTQRDDNDEPLQRGFLVRRI